MMSLCIGLTYTMAHFMLSRTDLSVYPEAWQGSTVNVLLLVDPTNFKISNPPHSFNFGKASSMCTLKLSTLFSSPAKGNPK